MRFKQGFAFVGLALALFGIASASIGDVSGRVDASPAPQIRQEDSKLRVGRHKLSEELKQYRLHRKGEDPSKISAVLIPISSGSCARKQFHGTIVPLGAQKPGVTIVGRPGSLPWGVKLSDNWIKGQYFYPELVRPQILLCQLLPDGSSEPWSWILTSLGAPNETELAKASPVGLIKNGPFEGQPVYSLTKVAPK